VRELIKSGQLEFVNGGWSQPDEACSNYEDLLQNFNIAHRFLYQEFGVIPKIGWQLDPFGHSSTYAKLLCDLGYEALVLGRIDLEEV
jgi:alpha-mannosidase